MMRSPRGDPRGDCTVRRLEQNVPRQVLARYTRKTSMPASCVCNMNQWEANVGTVGETPFHRGVCQSMNDSALIPSHLRRSHLSRFKADQCHMSCLSG